MPLRQRVLFLQLPQLDNDMRQAGENIPLAAAYLQYAAEQAGEGRHYEFARLPDASLCDDNHSLLQAILDQGPSVVACSLYLWNIERTLRLLRLLKQQRPGMKIILGGPECDTRHPFLFKSPLADAIAVGEGETVFPALLRKIRTGEPVDYSSVAIRSRQGYEWGRFPAPPVALTRHLPPPGYGACRPAAQGMAYLECSRGCPMRCTYCRYPHLRQSMSFLTPGEIAARIRALRRMGAREIRFVDPTFNAHPHFREIIHGLSRLNHSGTLSFFAELDAARITDDEARLLAAARFTEVEVGVQSRDPVVLKTVQRPVMLDRLDAGIRRLARHRIKVTVDIMYGLPRQSVTDVRQSVNWALALPHANVQCLQTLLLPGTELRLRHRHWKMTAAARPPYAVMKTDTMGTEAFQAVEAMVSGNPRLRSDIPTPRFAGARLDLFRERIRIRPGERVPAGHESRRAYLFGGIDLFGRRLEIGRFIKHVIQREPDSLFQFVLCPRQEEPLDLLDELIGVIRSQPSHLIDRYAPVALPGKIASRRLMVRIPGSRNLSASWVREADALLARAFF